MKECLASPCKICKSRKNMSLEGLSLSNLPDLPIFRRKGIELAED
jgi:hypothetical protein